uniref:DNA-directed RNA polymerase n=1 Tax=viral metagenome TaxID=1070528 RepID=A0A6C0CZZ1_9ZZZZ
MKRSLTESEINDILSFIVPKKGIPIETAESIVNSHKKYFRTQLSKQLVYPEIIPILKIKLEKIYNESMIQPGESVGILCAQSIGEKNTQLTLNTFHKAGQSEKAVTAGVPRFQELLNATRDPRAINCKVFFKYGNSTIQELRETIGSSIVGLTLSDISSNIKIYMNKKPEKWYETYKILYNNNFENYKNCISITLNIAKLFEYKITIEEVAHAITNSYADLCCIFSPPSIGQLDVFVDTSNINLPAERILFINTENAPEIFMEECVQPTLEKMLICGIPGITYIYYTREKDEWIIETEGSNYSKILAHPKVDMTKTISNNVWDIYETLGIEAARQFLIEEFMEIMDGINVCHSKLLVDRMTFSGTIASISRYTLRKEDSGPFGKSSFEESLSNFCAAAAVGDLEPVRGVSSAIVCGKRANIGSGMCELRINVKGLKKVVERTFE